MVGETPGADPENSERAYEVCFALFSCIMRALKVMANERLFAGQWMATQHGAGTQTPRIKRVDFRTPFQVFLS